jgi:hypothetical protein
MQVPWLVVGKEIDEEKVEGEGDNLTGPHLISTASQETETTRALHHTGNPSYPRSSQQKEREGEEKKTREKKNMRRDEKSTEGENDERWL